jgi:pimeloyl-ACP methyl ester carboxylesterase
MADFTETSLHVLGGKVELLKGGSGSPLIVFHHDIGNPGWLPYYDELAKKYTVYVPSHPGFGKSERPEWARNVRDIACIYHCLVRELGHDSTAAVGLGFGAWIAAEMATMCRHQFTHLVLVNATGIQPPSGEIMDQFLVSTLDYVRAGFSDQSKFVELYKERPDVEQLVQWEINREMTTRIAYKPYMFNQALPHLVKAVAVPTLIVWGRDNRIVPYSCGERYQQLMPNAKLLVVDGGHYLEVEKPYDLTRLTNSFIPTL